MKSSIDCKEPSFLSRTAKEKVHPWRYGRQHGHFTATNAQRQLVELLSVEGEASLHLGCGWMRVIGVVVGVCLTFRCTSSPRAPHRPCTLLFKKPCFKTIAAPSKPGVRRYRCSQIEHETASVTGDEGMQERSYTRDKTCARTHAHHHQPCEYRQDCRLHQPHEGTSEGESNTDPH